MVQRPRGIAAAAGFAAQVLAQLHPTRFQSPFSRHSIIAPGADAMSGALGVVGEETAIGSLLQAAEPVVPMIERVDRQRERGDRLQTVADFYDIRYL